MDARVSRKEQRWQPQTGTTYQTLVDQVFDFYPVYGNRFDQNVITDIEMLDDANAEVLDRAMFAIVKQRGADPVDASDGIQWAEYLLGEIFAPIIYAQVSDAVIVEGPGVKLTSTPSKYGMDFTVSLTQPPRNRLT